MLLANHPYVLIVGALQVRLLHKGRVVMCAAQDDKAAYDELVEYCRKLRPSSFIIAFHDDQVVLRTETLPPLSPIDRLKLTLRRMRQQFSGVSGWHALRQNEILSYGLQHGGAFDDWRKTLSRHICYLALLPLEAVFLSDVALQGKNVIVVAQTQSSGAVHFVVRNGEVVLFRLVSGDKEQRLLEDVLATRDYTPRLGVDKGSLAFAVLSADAQWRQQSELLLHPYVSILNLPMQTASVDEAMAARLMYGQIRHPLHKISTSHLILSWFTPLRSMRCAQIVCVTMLVLASCFIRNGWSLYQQCQQFEKLNTQLASAPAAPVDARLRQARERFKRFHEPAASPAALLQQLHDITGDQLLSHFSWRLDAHKKVTADITIHSSQDTVSFMQQAQAQLQDYAIEDANKDWLSSMENSNPNEAGHHLRLVQR